MPQAVQPAAKWRNGIINEKRRFANLCRRLDSLRHDFRRTSRSSRSFLVPTCTSERAPIELGFAFSGKVVVMAIDQITVRGARQHNLKNISLQIPRNRLSVITGLSGSGKSSLAFDTIYAEGQRRYVESLSAYARQFLEQLEKPDVDAVEGLSPAISIEQKTTAGARARPWER